MVCHACVTAILPARQRLLLSVWLPRRKGWSPGGKCGNQLSMHSLAHISKERRTWGLSWNWGACQGSLSFHWDRRGRSRGLHVWWSVAGGLRALLMCVGCAVSQAALPLLFPERRLLGQGSHPCRNLSWHKHQQESADCHFLFELFCVKTKRFGAGCKIVILSPRARVFPHPNGEHLWWKPPISS